MIRGEQEPSEPLSFPAGSTRIDRAWATLALLERDFRAELLGMEVAEGGVRIDVRIAIP
jgi:hypothetical protein